MTVIETSAGAEAEPVLTVRELRVGYTSAGTAAEVVKGVTFQLRRGRTLALVGESGSGKTTIGRALLGLLPGNGEILAGQIHLAGEDLRAATARQWRDLRGWRISLIPQDPTVSLSPLIPVGAQIAEALELHGAGESRQDRWRRAVEILETVGIPDPDRLAHHYPHQLSGGQQQRVLIGIAIVNEPDVIVADEPTSGLDVTVQRVILDLLDELQASRGTAILHITHDLAVAADRADDVLVLRDGEVVEEGSSGEVLAHPHSEYAIRLVENARAEGTRTVASDVGERPLVLRVENLTKRYPGRRGRDDVLAVDDLSFVVHSGQTVSLVGESGSGKTTTGRIVAKLLAADSGRILLDGQDVTELSERRFRRFRDRIQVVYQNPYASLDPSLTIAASIESPLLGLTGDDRPTRRRKVLDALDAVELPRAYAQRRPHELSGGQRQRVAIARAVVAHPALIVLDEPVSALDVTVQEQILDLLNGLQRERGLSYLFITHDLGVVRRISDHVVVLSRGRAVEEGPVGRIFLDPRTEHTRALLDAIPGGHPRRSRAPQGTGA